MKTRSLTPPMRATSLMLARNPLRQRPSSTRRRQPRASPRPPSTGLSDPSDGLIPVKGWGSAPQKANPELGALHQAWFLRAF